MSAPAPNRPAYPVVTDPARPAWHFHPPAFWMNDPNGIAWHEGWCHLFYQHNPGGDTWADMHWGHARSRDLVHWVHLPIALQPQSAAGEGHCYSGCLARTASGEARILYTSVPPNRTDPVTQVLATPGDPHWEKWTQHVATPFLALTTHDGPAFDRDWRDPFVFKSGNRTFLIIGATLGDEAVVVLYENPDGQLQDWTYRGILLRAPRTTTPFFECPGIARCGDQWVLFVCPCHEVEWHAGTLDLERAEFRIQTSGRYDESDHFYATHPIIDPQGRLLVFGWVQKFPTGRGWNGCMGALRRAWLDADGMLCSEPIAKLKILRESATPLPPTDLNANALALPLPASGMAEGELMLHISSASQVRIEIPGVVAELSANGVSFNGRPPVTLGGDAKAIKVRWLLDRSLFEVFVNDRASYTRVVPFPITTPMHVSAAHGLNQLVGGTIWALRANSAFADPSRHV